MKKNSRSKGRAGAAPQLDPYLEGMMTKLTDRLAGLERKIDTVISAVSALRHSGGPDPRAAAAAAQNQNLQAKERAARRERVMFEAICADCKVPCEVPFRPSEGRAIYCRECFAKRRANGTHRPAGPVGPGQPNAPAPSTPPAPKPAAAVKPAHKPAARSASKPVSKKPAAKKSKKK